MKQKKTVYWLVFLILISPGISVFSSTMNDPEEMSQGKVAIFEKLGSYIPLDTDFVDTGGNRVLLRDLIDKPAVVALVYFSCRHACPMILNGLSEVLGKTDLKAGKDFDVITISFDDRDTPEIAADKKKNYIHAIGRPFPEKEWKFLVGKEESIAKFTESVGFTFKKIEDGTFAHPVTLVILSSKGRVTRYLSGTTYLPFDLEMAVTEASEGRVGSIVKRAVLYCFSYDPKSQKYVFNILRIVGIFTILCAASFVTFLIITGKKYGGRAG